jgi:hypothetical protein
MEFMQAIRAHMMIKTAEHVLSSEHEKMPLIGDSESEFGKTSPILQFPQDIIRAFPPCY